jgi:hypothetical protein
MSLVFRSSYLSWICLYMFLGSIAGTLLYFLQADIVSSSASSITSLVWLMAWVCSSIGAQNRQRPQVYRYKENPNNLIIPNAQWLLLTKEVCLVNDQ